MHIGAPSKAHCSRAVALWIKSYSFLLPEVRGPQRSGLSFSKLIGARTWRQVTEGFCRESCGARACLGSSKGFRSARANSPMENGPEEKDEFLKAVVLSVAVSERAGQEYDGLSLEDGQTTFKFQNRLKYFS